METVVIQINSNKVYKLLKDLEELNLIKMLEKSSTSKYKISEKYRGKLPSGVADELQDYVSESRTEWSNRNI